MKYRVIVNVRWNDIYFDFDDKEEAVIFLEKLFANYAGNDEEDQQSVRFNASMTIIKESPAEGSSEEPSETADIEGISTT